MCLPPTLATVINPNDFSSITTLLLGGEKLTPKMLTNTLRANRRVFNVYGPTETTICVSMQQLTDIVEPNQIGKPLANIRFYVVNLDNELCPIGTPGELYISGLGLAQGYWKNPQLSQQQFVPNQFISPEEKDFKIHARVYKTGDKVLWKPDGTLLYLERMDKQIKWHGFRIEPEEIEKVLLTYPEIKQVIVLLKQLKK